jgi:hypothetical protein
MPNARAVSGWCQCPKAEVQARPEGLYGGFPGLLAGTCLRFLICHIVTLTQCPKSPSLVIAKIY